MKARTLVPAVLAAVIGLTGYWFYANFERVPAKRKVGMSGEARLRDFLAAERFAERMGMRAGELRSLPEIDSLVAQQKAGGVLVVPNRRQALEEARMGRMLDWAAGGGHLIVEAEYLGVSDPLLELLKVTREAGKPLPKPLAVELRGRSYQVGLRDVLSLTHQGRPLASAGGKVLVLPHGKGVVTVATSLHFARNAWIGEHDHAAFLWALFELTPAKDLRVYFRPERLSLWGFLKENAAPVLIASLALLVAWLWRIAPRFGPVTPDAPPARRRLLDHLRASGRYFWANGLRPRLVLAARDAALRRLARAQPDFADASQAEKASRLAALTNLSNEEASRFLLASGAMRGADFIRATQHAQRIHSVLEKGDR